MDIKDYLKTDGEYSYLEIKVTPGSSKNEFFSILDDGTLKIRIKAPAENGKANKELIKFLSDELNIKKDDIEIISGASDQKKIIRINNKNIFNLKYDEFI